MKVYVTITGHDSILGGYVILAMAFYKESPPNLITFYEKLLKNHTYLPQERSFKQILKFSDYFYYDYDLIPTYDKLADYYKWRDTAQRLVLSLRCKLLLPLDEIIYNNLIPSSTDFKVTYANKISNYLPLYLAHYLAGYIRLKELNLIKVQYPVYKVEKHLGSKSVIHFDEILNNGICVYHHPNTLEYTARYLQREINYKNDEILCYKNFLNRLPAWWRDASGKHSLKDYFTEEEVKELKVNLKFCRQHQLYKNKDKSLLLPPQRKFPPKFEKWLKDNPC